MVLICYKYVPSCLTFNNASFVLNAIQIKLYQINSHSATTVFENYSMYFSYIFVALTAKFYTVYNDSEVCP